MSIETMVAIIMVAMMATFAYSDKNNNEVKKACYEAMKTTPNLQCNRP